MNGLLVRFLAIAAFSISGAALAQESSPTMEDAVAEAQQAFGTITKFVGDVRFDEKDVKSVITLWSEFQDLGDEIAFDLDTDIDTPETLERVLKQPAYVSWIERHDLDENWLRKVLRIQLLMAIDEFEAQSAEGRAQMQAQRAEMEKMREQVGEDVYRQMLQAMDAGMSMMDSVAAAISKLPPASDKERTLLEKYEKELSKLN